MEIQPYFRFVGCLAAGLAGLCMTLRVLLDTLFADWDVVEDVRYRLRHSRRHAVHTDSQWKQIEHAGSDVESLPLHSRI